MPQMTMVQAITDALRGAPREDPRVGVPDANVGRNGGVVRATEGPQAGLGPERVTDTRPAGNGIIVGAIVAEQALTSLQSPVLRVTGWDTPFPYPLEHTSLPGSRRVLAAIEHSMGH